MSPRASIALAAVFQKHVAAFWRASAVIDWTLAAFQNHFHCGNNIVIVHHFWGFSPYSGGSMLSRARRTAAMRRFRNGLEALAPSITAWSAF